MFFTRAVWGCRLATLRVSNLVRVCSNVVMVYADSLFCIFADGSSHGTTLLIGRNAMFNRYHARAQGYETRYVLYSCTLIAVGLGSALYHATLRYDMQMLDELPMMYAMCVWAYIWLEVAHPTVKRQWLVPCILAVALIITVGHVSFGFVQTFQITFVMMVLAGYVVREEGAAVGVTFCWCWNRAPQSTFPGGLTLFADTTRHICAEHSWLDVVYEAAHHADVRDSGADATTLSCNLKGATTCTCITNLLWRMTLE